MNHRHFVFDQIHIEITRNAIDDFNLFHDQHKWSLIANNPFKGPIVLGFQLNALIEYQLRLYREAHKEQSLLTQHDLRFSNYYIVFIKPVSPGLPVFLDINQTRMSTFPRTTLKNRIILRSRENTHLLCVKKETSKPMFLSKVTFDHYPDLSEVKDATFIFDSGVFLKRKRLNNGIVKNFLSGSLVEQADYFDELKQLETYPEMFPCSLVSSVLLEKEMRQNYNFIKDPMVYKSHAISVDRLHLQTIKHDQQLHILIESKAEFNQLSDIKSITYYCYGLIANNQVLFRMIVNLVPL